MEVVDQALQPIVDLVGFPADQVLQIQAFFLFLQIKCVLCLLTAIPLGLLWRNLPGPTARHLFSIIGGIAFLVFCLGPTAWLHSLFTSLVTYAMISFLPASVSHKVVFAFAFSYLSASHIYRIVTDYMGWTLDFTGSQMVVTLKLISTAFNVHDANTLKLVPTYDGTEKSEERERKLLLIKNIEVCIRTDAVSLILAVSC